MNRAPEKEITPFKPRAIRGAHRRTAAKQRTAIQLLLNAAQLEKGVTT